MKKNVPKHKKCSGTFSFIVREILIYLAPSHPFMGGGSVGEACIKTGRSYVGMELSREYYAISRNRLTASLAEKA